MQVRVGNLWLGSHLSQLHSELEATIKAKRARQRCLPLFEKKRNLSERGGQQLEIEPYDPFDMHQELAYQIKLELRIVHS